MLVSTMRCTRGDALSNSAVRQVGLLGGLHVISLLNRSGRQAFGPLIRKLRSLGVDSDTELDAVLGRIKVRAGIRRGEDIIASGRSPMHSTLLLDGVACLYERLQDGTRQIYVFQYSGDFCDLHRHVLREMNNEVAVAAITDCSIGIFEHRDLEQLIAQYPTLGLALWRASMLEASIFRKRLLNVGRQPALQRVAHLLCEQLARREAVGLTSATIPLTQMDLADAAGLSIVHINRTFQELRRLNILSKGGPRHHSGRQRTARRAGQFRRQLPQHAAAAVTLAGQDRERPNACRTIARHVASAHFCSKLVFKVSSPKGRSEEATRIALSRATPRPPTLCNGAGYGASASQKRGEPRHRAHRLIATGAFADYPFRGSE